MNKKNFKKENGEDSTKYGEFVSSFFSWIGLKEQKERTKDLENMTNKKGEEKWRKIIKNNEKKRKIKI